MSTPTAKQVLDANHAIRRGNAQKPRRLDGFEVSFRIPEADWPALLRLYPDLNASDNEVKHKAWLKFRESPIAEKYLVTRTPNQVRRSNNHRVIIK